MLVWFWLHREGQSVVLEKMTGKLTSGSSRRKPSSSEISNASKSACSSSLPWVSMSSVLLCPDTHTQISIFKLLLCPSTTLSHPIIWTPTHPLPLTKSQWDFLHFNVRALRCEPELPYFVQYAVEKDSFLIFQLSMKEIGNNSCCQTTEIVMHTFCRRNQRNTMIMWLDICNIDEYVWAGYSIHTAAVWSNPLYSDELLKNCAF